MQYMGDLRAWPQTMMTHTHTSIHVCTYKIYAMHVKYFVCLCAHILEFCGARREAIAESIGDEESAQLAEGYLEERLRQGCDVGSSYESCRCSPAK